MRSEWFKKWDDDGEYDRDYWSRTSDRDDASDDDSSSGGWWDKFHGKGKSSSSYTPVKSTSAYLRSSWSGSWTPSAKVSRSDDMLEVLKEVNKTINLTVNSEGGKAEKSLVVRYSNGYVRNDLTSEVLYISPNIMLNKSGDVLDKSTDDYYSSLDALNGQAMLCSFMRKSVSPRANMQYQNSLNWAVRNIYMTDLQTTAGNEIRAEWPGFQSYIEQQQRVFAANKESVISDLMQPDQSIDNFINLLCYNRLSNDRIDYNNLFESDIANRMIEADRVFNETLDNPVDNNSRFNRANELFSRLQTIIDLNNPPPPPQPPCPSPPNDGDTEDKNDGQSQSNGGNSDEDGDEDGDNNASGNGDDKNDSDGEDESDASNGQGKIDVKSIDVNSTSQTNRRFTGDNSYNNADVITGDSEAAEVDPDAELKDRQKVERDNLKDIKDAQLDHASYRRVVPAVNSSTKTAYKDFVRGHRTAINNVKNCFQFHNTDFSLSTYGLASGSVDEGSFHKVFLGESERLYERRDVQARKKWLVTVLIDQSGSMDRSMRLPNGGYGIMMEQARGLSIIFAEALKGLKEVDFSMYGFSTTGSTIDTYCYQDKQTKKLEALIEAGYHNGTGIGFHVAHVGDKMLTQYPDYENRILFVITDGEPNMTPTPTMNGYQHTHHCCELLRKRGIHVFGIGIANAFGPDVGQMLFGSGNFTILNDVQSTLNVLTNSLRNFFKKMKK